MNATNLLSETVISLPEAAKRLPLIDGKRPSATSIWRWAVKGLSSPSGPIRLESRCIGKRLVTSVQALDRFTLAVAESRRAALEGEIPDQRPQYRRHRTDRQRDRDIERAERICESMGV